MRSCGVPCHDSSLVPFIIIGRTCEVGVSPAQANKCIIIIRPMCSIAICDIANNLNECALLLQNKWHRECLVLFSSSSYETRIFLIDQLNGYYIAQ
jgi:hypothetical protein